MKRFFTKQTVLIILVILFFLIAWNRAANLLYVMFALLTATLIIAHILPRYSLRDVLATRSIPSTAFEDDEVDVEVCVQNKGWMSRYMIEVVDSIPAAEPDSRSPMTFIARLPKRQNRKYSFKLSCYKRGEYTVGPLTVRSSYPLGISSIEKPLPEGIQTLLVYPQVFDIERFPLIAASNTPMVGVESVMIAGGSDEFFGTREYRQGDSLRHIHWLSTARHSELIVKEFEIRSSTEATLIIDLHKKSDIGTGKETTLEYAVKIAASIARYVLERGHSFQLIGYGERPHIVSSSRGINHLAAVLETLARVKAEGGIAYPDAIYQSSELLRDGGAVVLIFSQLSGEPDKYLYSIGLLKAKRMRPVCIFLNRESFLDNKAKSMERQNPLIDELIGEGIPVYFVSKGDNLQEIFRI
ncbi:MAG: DUF58 domain-containing protein [Nitrospirae bacterium]|nr:DUF58 domain-containing protein [Nitrospirota bacterium]